MLFFGQKCDVGRTGIRTDRRTDTSPHTSAVFSSSYKLPKTLTVSTLLLFGHVTLLCGTYLFIKLSEEPVQLTNRPIALDTRSRLTHSHWFGSPIIQH